MAVHGDDCAKCHPTPADSMTYDGTCSQPSCHPSPHSTMPGYDPGHSGGHGDEGCWDCHEGDEGSCTIPACHPHLYERVPPVTVSNASSSYTGSAVVALTAVDEGEYGGWAPARWYISGVKQTHYQVNGGALHTGNIVLIAAPASGTVKQTIEFWSLDNYYNVETHKFVSFNVSAGGGPDTTAPTGTMSVNGGAAYTNVVAVTLNSDVSDAGSGVAQMRVDPGTGVFGGWVDYSGSYPITLPAANGSKTVRAEYKDLSDNVLSLSDTITLDTVAPTGTMRVNNNDLYTNDTVVTINSSVTDALSGVTEMRVNPGSGIYGSWVPYTPALSVTMPAGSGTRYVYAQYRDAAGNVYSPTYDTIVLDQIVPTGTMSVNNNATYATSTAATLNSSVTDVGSGMSQMRIDPGSGTFGGWIPYNATYAFTLASGDGSKTVRAEYRDYALNVLARSDTITLDTTGPTGTMVVASDAATTNVTAVSVNSAMSDATSGMFQMRIDPGTGTYGAWVGYAATYAISLPSGDGLKTVNVQYSNNAGLITTRTDTIFLDTGVGDATPPDGSIVIDAGAAWTGVTAVALTPSATDSGGSGVWQMRFSNDNAVWSGWEAYATSKSWTIASAPGIETVFAQYRDGAGNLSAVYNDTIGLDVVAPSGSMLVNNGDATTASTVVLVDSVVVDLQSGMSQMRIDPGTGTYGAWIPYTSSTTVNLPFGDGERTVRVEYRDAVANVLALTDTITVVGGVSGGTQTFSYTGADQTFVVPAGVYTLTVDLYGASGGDHDTAWGGAGGHVHAAVPVTPGQTLTVRVGGAGADGVAGWPNGGAGPHGGGGGGSSSLLSGASIWAEAGAGGGGDHIEEGPSGGDGGYQGWLPGGNQVGDSVDGAGGGGGWNGGVANAQHDGGADGGSSYIANGVGTLDQGVHSGDGSVTIAWPPTGTIEFAWDAADGSWATVWVYDADDNLIYTESDPNWSPQGWFIVQVPVSSQAYRLEAHWYDSYTDWEDWSYSSALIDTPGKVVTWGY